MDQETNNGAPPPIPEIPVVLEMGNKKKIKLRTIIILMFAGFFLSVVLFDYVRFKGEEKRLKTHLDKNKLELDKLRTIARDMDALEREETEKDEMLLRAETLLPDSLSSDAFQEDLEGWLDKSHLKIKNIDFTKEKSELYSVGIFDLTLEGKIKSPGEFIGSKEEFERLVNISVPQVKGNEISVKIKIFSVNKPFKKGPTRIKKKDLSKPKTIIFWPFTKRIKELKKSIEETKEELSNFSMEKERYEILREKQKKLEYLLKIINGLESGDAEVKRLKKKAVQFFNRGKAYFDAKRYEEAIIEFDQAIALSPEDDKSYLYRGMAYFSTEEFDLAIEDFNLFIEANPDDSQGYMNRSMVYSRKGEYINAHDDLVMTKKLTPNNPGVDNNLAWFLATCPDEKYRDGKKAVQLALKACKDTGWNYSFKIDTLAASYAETGDFENAVKYQQMAVDKEQDPKTKKGMIERLELYKSGKPYREN